MNPTISIIVAVYQVSPYLRECLKSIRRQSYRNLEVILVDDGSDDGSEEICEEFADADARFQVIHQKNQGTADARKTGLRRAKGEYIGFVDGDDWVEKDMYEQLLLSLQSVHADVSICLKQIEHNQAGYSFAEDPVVQEGVYTKKKDKRDLRLFVLGQGRAERGDQHQSGR